MQIDRRKIIQNGPSSLSISLPSSWTKKHNINKGDNIDIIQKSDILEIKVTNKNNNIKKKEISFTEIDKETKEDIILSLYLKNYDIIKIICPSNKIQKEIYTILHELSLGYEIIEQTSNHIIIKNLSSPSEEEFENLLKRAYKITIEYSTKIQTIIENQEDITRTCLLHELTLNKILNYAKRINAKQNKENSPLIHSIIENLKEISYNLTNLLEIIEKEEIAETTELINNFKQTNNILNKTINLYYLFSINNYSKIKKELNNNLKKIKEEEELEELDVNKVKILKNINKNISNLLNSIFTIRI